MDDGVSEEILPKFLFSVACNIKSWNDDYADKCGLRKQKTRSQFIRPTHGLLHFLFMTSINFTCSDVHPC